MTLVQINEKKYVSISRYYGAMAKIAKFLKLNLGIKGQIHGQSGRKLVSKRIMYANKMALLGLAVC